MVKKICTLFLGLMCFAGLQAQTESTIDTSEILYWVGSGNSKAILVVDFGTDAYAWGYRYDANDEPTALDMITEIDAADPRLAYSIDWATYAMNFYYVEYPKKLVDSVYRFKVDGELAEAGDEFSDYDLENNMVVKVSCTTGDVWSTPITAVTTATMPVFDDIDEEEILYWAGEGQKKVVVAIYWSEPEMALAWGYRFDSETLSVAALFDALNAADPRLTLTDNSYSYVSSGWKLNFREDSGNILQFSIDGYIWPGWSSILEDGDVVRVGESLYGTGYDSTSYAGAWFPAGVVWESTVVPVRDPDHDIVEATIAANDILNWVGTGSKKAIVAVNWAAPDTCLAWGFRYDGNATLKDAMDAIAAADPRFSYAASGSLLTDILYVEGTMDTLKLTPESSSPWGNYWTFNVNGFMGMNYFDGQVLNDGDFVKWGDPNSGSVYGIGEWGMDILVWTTTVTPATVPGNGIQSVAEGTFSVWPNPAVVSVNVRRAVSEQAVVATLFDVTGRQVYTTTVPAGVNEFTIPVRDLMSGVYMLRMGDRQAKILVR